MPRTPKRRLGPNYLIRINGRILPKRYKFLTALKMMRKISYDSKVDPSKRELFEVLLPDGAVHYTDRRS